VLSNSSVCELTTPIGSSINSDYSTESILKKPKSLFKNQTKTKSLPIHNDFCYITFYPPPGINRIVCSRNKKSSSSKDPN